MMDYENVQGKINTRYSELLRCTTKQIHSVVKERQGQKRQLSTKHLVFGTLRHDMFLEESRDTGRVPATFNMSMSVEMVEEELATEIIPGVILHGRPDAFSTSSAAVIDYKTVGRRLDTKIIHKELVPKKYSKGVDHNGADRGFILGRIISDAKKGIVIPGIEIGDMDIAKHTRLYQNSKQLLTYCYMLYANGYIVRRTIYMIEVWRKEDLKIEGYAYLDQPVTMVQIATHKKWLIERATLLQMALRAKGLA